MPLIRVQSAGICSWRRGWVSCYVHSNRDGECEEWGPPCLWSNPSPNPLEYSRIEAACTRTASLFPGKFFSADISPLVAWWSLANHVWGERADGCRLTSPTELLVFPPLHFACACSGALRFALRPGETCTKHSINRRRFSMFAVLHGDNAVCIRAREGDRFTLRRC